jgi:hypothetical protein
MLKINLYKPGRPCPAVSYHHCLLSRPMRIFKYPRFPFKNKTVIIIFAKFMAMIHDYILCTDDDLGIQYGIFYQDKK